MSDITTLLRRSAAVAVGVFVLGALPVRAAPTEPSGGQGILVMLRMPLDHHRPDAAYGGDYGDQFTVAARRRMAQRIARRYGLDYVGDGWEMPLLGVDCYVMRVRPDEMIETAMKRIAGDPEIVWSQPMHVFSAQGSGSISR